MRRLVAVFGSAMMVWGLGCAPRVKSRPLAPPSPNPSAGKALGVVQWSAPAKELLACHGQSWGDGHLPNPFARYYSTFEGLVQFGGEHAVVHLEFAYTDTHGTNSQVFSGKKLWPWGHKKPVPYVFHYQHKPYDLDHLDVARNAIGAQFFFPQAWRALVETKQNQRSKGAGLKNRNALQDNIEIQDLQVDDQGGLKGLSFQLSDEILGARSFEVSWSEPAKGQREIQVFENNKLAMSAQCRKVTNEQASFAKAPVADAKAWQSAQRPSREAIAKLELVDLEPGLVAVRFPASNCQSLALVQEDGISVFEAPVSPKHSELLLSKLNARFGEMPIKRVYVTHHHPAHAGGVATYVQAGIPVVTTAQNAEYFSQVIRTWRRTQSSAKGRAKVPMHFEVVREQSRFGPKGQGVVALNLGEDSAHTDEHLVFILEAQNLVFNGDLFFVPRNQEKPRPAGKRAQGLFSALTRRALVNDETRVVSAWPIEKVKTVARWDELKSSVSLAR